MAFYSVRTEGQSYRVVRMDEYDNVLGIFEVYSLGGKWHCNKCSRGTCFHCVLRDTFVREKRVDTGWRFNSDNGKWRPPNSVQLLRQSSKPYCSLCGLTVIEAIRTGRCRTPVGSSEFTNTSDCYQRLARRVA